MKKIGWICLKSLCDRKIFSPKLEEVTREWRKFNTEGFHNFHSSSDIIKDNVVGGTGIVFG